MTDGLRIAVLGAGYVGSAFARAAASDTRHTVWAVRRTAGESADGVTWLRGDVARGAIENFPTQLDAIVLTVAPARSTDAYDAYDATYPPCATAAVALARASGATRLVYTSSTGVYGGRDGAWVSESRARLGVGGTNAALIAAEDIVLDAGIAAPTVLRVAGIYGPGRDPRARMMKVDALAQRGEYWTNLAHRDDIVAALRHVLALTDPPRVLNVSDGSPQRAADVARWLCAQAGADSASLLFGNDAQRSRNDQRVSNAALVATGWAPIYPSFREGFAIGL